MIYKQHEEFAYQAVLNGDLEIHDDGTIWRVRIRGWSHRLKANISLPCAPRRAEHKQTMRNGAVYLTIQVMLNRKLFRPQAHRLVFLHFKGHIPPGLTVNHEDGVPTNNHPDNLTLATMSEQHLHSWRVLKRRNHIHGKGESSPVHKLSNEKVYEIRRLYALGESFASIARRFEISGTHVTGIARGLRWTHLRKVVEAVKEP